MIFDYQIKLKKAKKFLLEHRGARLLGRKLLDKISTNCSYLGFKIKLMQKKTSRDGNSYEKEEEEEEEEENFGARIYFFDCAKSHVEREKSRGVLHDNSNNIFYIVNGCDGTTNLVTIFCDRAILIHRLA